MLLRQGVQFGVTIALARLITPAEFGTVAIMSLFTGVATTLVDGGLSTMAIVTEEGFVYGVARMFAVFAEVFGLRVRACRSMDEAERWLKGEDPEDS